MSPDSVTLPQTRVPVLAAVDVLVCGGGPAGVAAAVAAGRMGAHTLLLERYNHLGGLATGGQVILLPPFADTGRPIIGGIGLEIRERLVARGAAGWNRVTDHSHYDPEALKTLCLEMLQEAGARVLLHSWCADVLVEGSQLCGVVTLSKAGYQAYAAKVIVDATGDLDVGARAGAECEKSDGGVGVPFRIGGVDIARWQQARREEPERVQAVHGKAQAAGGWERFLGLDPVATPTSQHDVVWANNFVRVANGLDPDELTLLEIEGRQMAQRALEVLRAEMPGFERAWIVDFATQTGVRYTRRLVGEYVLTQQDVSQFDFRHPESVARGNDFRRQGVAYDIPRGALISRNVPNLLSAGRCISCTHEALEPLREIHVCWATGQAAGVLAALAAEQGGAPQEVAITHLRQELTRQGAVVGGMDG